VKAEETLYDLFLWPSGQFECREGEVPRDIRVTYETPVTPVILEGIRRVDEWKRIREVFSSMATSFTLVDNPSAPPARSENPVLELAADGRTIAEISLEIRRSEFETAALLFDLHARGLVKVDKTRAEAPSRIPSERSTPCWPSRTSGSRRSDSTRPARPTKTFWPSTG